MNKLSFGFTIISGVGWLLDLAVMSILVQLSVEPGVSNFISASMAATLVYWAGRRLLFKKEFGLAATGGYVFYLLYTAAVVMFFSLLIQYSSISLYDYVSHAGYQLSLVVIAFVVKVFYTPFNLALNYIVSSNLAKRF